MVNDSYSLSSGFATHVPPAPVKAWLGSAVSTVPLPCLGKQGSDVHSHRVFPLCQPYDKYLSAYLLSPRNCNILQIRKTRLGRVK